MKIAQLWSSVTCCIALADLLVDEEHFDEFNTSGEMA
jgi:hypothetical protein